MDVKGEEVMTYECVGGEGHAFQVVEPFFALFGGDFARGALG